MTGADPTSGAPPPEVPAATSRLPPWILWAVPIGLVVAYVFVVVHFFPGQARWTGNRWIEVLVLLVATTLLLCFAWYGLAYLGAWVLGEFATLGVLRLIAGFPGLHRHVVITPPQRPDSPREVWGRFGILLLISLGFELIFMVLLVKRGDLAPRLAIGLPLRFVADEGFAGLGLALLIAPAAPFLASRLRTRITDSLEFPLLWLALLLLVVGGASILELEILPGAVFDTALFLTSILLYAPAAWCVSVGFSRAEQRAQSSFLRRAWRARGRTFHFGRIAVSEEPEGTVVNV